MDARRRDGERFDRVIASTPSAELVEALAAAAKEDAVAANVIATALLNRIHQARLFGALLGIAIVALLSGLLLVGIDVATTGTVGLLETQPAGLDVATVGLAGLGLGLAALVAAFVAWLRVASRR